MLKSIRKFFYGDELKEYKVVEKPENHMLDWLYEGNDMEDRIRAIRREDYRMVGEPVLTLISSLKKNHKRFTIQEISVDEYKEYCDSEVYDWMYGVSGNYESIRFMRFNDEDSGISKTLIVSKDTVYRIDGLNFELNYWEKKALYLAFHKAKSRGAARKRKNRINNMIAKRERIEKAKLDQIERMKYAEIFK